MAWTATQVNFSKLFKVGPRLFAESNKIGEHEIIFFVYYLHNFGDHDSVYWISESKDSCLEMIPLICRIKCVISLALSNLVWSNFWWKSKIFQRMSIWTRLLSRSSIKLMWSWSENFISKVFQVFSSVDPTHSFRCSMNSLVASAKPIHLKGHKTVSSVDTLGRCCSKYWIGVQSSWDIGRFMGVALFRIWRLNLGLRRFERREFEKPK